MRVLMPFILIRREVRMKRLWVVAVAALLVGFAVSDEAAARPAHRAGAGHHHGVGVGARGVGVVRHPVAARAAVRRCAAGVTC
jgi:hypothetical protein